MCVIQTLLHKDCACSSQKYQLENATIWFLILCANSFLIQGFSLLQFSEVCKDFVSLIVTYIFQLYFQGITGEYLYLVFQHFNVQLCRIWNSFLYFIIFLSGYSDHNVCNRRQNRSDLLVSCWLVGWLFALLYNPEDGYCIFIQNFYQTTWCYIPEESCLHISVCFPTSLPYLYL